MSRSIVLYRDDFNFKIKDSSCKMSDVLPLPPWKSMGIQHLSVVFHKIFAVIFNKCGNPWCLARGHMGNGKFKEAIVCLTVCDSGVGCCIQ